MKYLLICNSLLATNQYNNFVLKAKILLVCYEEKNLKISIKLKSTRARLRIECSKKQLIWTTLPSTASNRPDHFILKIVIVFFVTLLWDINYLKKSRDTFGYIKCPWVNKTLGTASKSKSKTSWNVGYGNRNITNVSYE